MNKLVFYLILLLSLSCKKYEDGGLIKKGKENLPNTWKLTKYYQNENNETDKVVVIDYIETYSNDGTYSRQFIDKDNNLVQEKGTWQWINEKTVKISGVGSFEVASNSGTVSSSEYSVTKLDEFELFYHFENGGMKHQFRLVKQ